MLDAIYTENPAIIEKGPSSQVLEHIKDNIQSIKSQKIGPNEKNMIIFGETYEMIASEESHLDHPETETQRSVRKIIESAYQNAELIIGTAHERPSKPDGVTLNFDDEGRLVIDEIVELKSSNNAFVHGIDKGQPAKTLETIGAVVSIINKLKRGEETSKILPRDSDLSLDKRIKRDAALRRIKEQIQVAAKGNDPITFSKDLVYRVIVPKGETLPTFNPNLLKDAGYAVLIKVTQSTYSKKDIYNIIESIDS